MPTSLRKQNRLFLKIQKISFLLTFLVCILLLYSTILLKPWEKKARYISPIPIALGKVFVLQDSDSEKIAQLKINLEKKIIPVVSIQTSTQSAYIVTLSGGEEITISKNKSLDLQIDSLQLILTRLTIEGKKLTNLDFRYDKPIVVFK